MPEPMHRLLNESLVVINVGFAKSALNLEDQHIRVVRVDWRPSAGGDQEMIELLDQLL